MSVSSPRHHQRWDRVISVWSQARRGTEVVVRPKEGRALPRARSPQLCAFGNAEAVE